MVNEDVGRGGVWNLELGVQLKVLLYGKMGKNLCSQMIKPFLKNISSGDMTTEARRLFQYSMALAEKADPVLGLGISHLLFLLSNSDWYCHINKRPY